MLALVTLLAFVLENVEKKEGLTDFIMNGLASNLL